MASTTRRSAFLIVIISMIVLGEASHDMKRRLAENHPEADARRKELKAKLIAREKRRLLNSIGLNEPPQSASGNESFPQHIADEEEQTIRRAEREAEGVNKFFVRGQRTPTCSSAEGTCFEFHVREILELSAAIEVSGALYIGKNVDPRNGSIRAFVERPDEATELHLIDGKSAFDVSSELLASSTAPQNATDGLVIRVECDGGCPEAYRLEVLNPFLSVKTTSRQNIRRRRDDDSHDDSYDRDDEDCVDDCCIKSFIFDLTDPDLSRWIIGPNEYLLSYCTGTCHHSLEFDSAREVIVRAGQMDNLNDEPPKRRYCAPTSFGDLHMTYEIGKGEFRNLILKNALVKSCGCDHRARSPSSATV